MAYPSALTDRSPVTPAVDTFFKSDRPRTIDRYIDYFGGDGTRSWADAGDRMLVDAMTDGERTAWNGRAVPRVYPTGGHGRRLRAASVAALGLIALLLAACAGPTSSPSPSPSPRSDAGASRPSAKAIDPAQVDRLQRLWVPLLTAMNHPLQPNQVKIGLMDEPHINAANAGGGAFFVTSGLVQKANDDHLQAILAHETAHEDLGHVAKSQALGTGLNIGMVILDQIIPGTGALTPIAGQLISNAYGRNEEYAADKHGVDLLRRIGKSKEQMIDALTWLTQVEGNSPGGFFATHPATGDRIEALRQMK